MSGTWLWIDIPLCLLLFLAISGIPLWMVFKYPDTGPYSGGNGLGGRHNGLVRPTSASPQPVPSQCAGRPYDRNNRTDPCPS